MSTIFRTKYLSEQQLSGFNKYKYACIDNSPISVYISHPFWNWIVEFYPRWLPPNVLTLGGFLILISSFILVSIYDYNFNSNTFGFKQEEAIPNWIWLVCSIATFLAHLLDGTDGKQARRTGSSGPTGELCCISPYTMLCVLISVQLVFICSHWEKYNTGVLFLSWGYDASQYGLCIFHLFAFFANPKIFHSNLVEGLSLAYFIATTFFISCILSLASCLYNVYHAYIISKTGVQVFILFLEQNSLNFNGC
ncbi:unnamed protein product [Meloidogyne enterolobii]|uniref:Uncharacterized protein n=2 Tax=Meloidogyne enterolobii TaxID=390850 RepID=A0ACB0XMY5_MELEN